MERKKIGKRQKDVEKRKIFKRIRGRYNENKKYTEREETRKNYKIYIEI